jgi:uncharacterized protein
MTASSKARSLLVGLVALMAVAGGCAGVTAADHASPIIAVTAIGRVSLKPDVGLTTLGAEARAVTLAEATAEVTRRMTAVLARVRALGIQDADITTVGYSVDPIAAPRRPDDEATRIIAYRATNIVRIKVRALDRLGRVLDEAVAAGANVVRDVQFALAEPEAAQARARAEAVREATTRAQQLAAAAGVRLGELIYLNEGRGGPEPIVVPRMSMVSAAGPVEAGQLEVTITVDARWRLAR